MHARQIVRESDTRGQAGHRPLSVRPRPCRRPQFRPVRGDAGGRGCVQVAPVRGLVGLSAMRRPVTEMGDEWTGARHPRRATACWSPSRLPRFGGWTPLQEVAELLGRIRRGVISRGIAGTTPRHRPVSDRRGWWRRRELATDRRGSGERRSDARAIRRSGSGAWAAPTRCARGADDRALADPGRRLQDQRGQTGADEQRGACDEEVFHTHVLRSDAVRPRRLSRQGRRRAIASELLAVGGRELVYKVPDKLAQGGLQLPKADFGNRKERGRAVWVE